MSLSRRRSHDDTPAPVEINVVPLVDVSLVLLIIFLVTATFIKTSGLKLDLPTGAGAPMPAPRERIIEVGPNGELAWDGRRVSEAGLADALRREALAHGTMGVVTVRGDSRAALGRVVRAMSLAQSAGFTHQTVATQPPSGEKEPPGVP